MEKICDTDLLGAEHAVRMRFGWIQIEWMS